MSSRDTGKKALLFMKRPLINATVWLISKIKCFPNRSSNTPASTKPYFFTKGKRLGVLFSNRHPQFFTTEFPIDRYGLT